ncbi:DUF2399 domain-containing protein [bacterium]|nr:DUF2399 domain-containing protein [bacterium]
MISPSQIREKARRLYPKFVKSWLRGEAFFPHRVPADLKLPCDPTAARRAIDELRSVSKPRCQNGITVFWESKRSRTHGLNEFPTAIQIESQSDLLHLADAAEDFTLLETAVGTFRSRRPDLEVWLQESTHWKDILNAAPQLHDLLLMTQYLLDHPRPDCFAREIPLPVSTKLIEENSKLLSAWLDRLRPPAQIDFRYSRDEFERRYGLRHVRHHILMRVLDPEVQTRLGFRFQELSLPAESIGQLQPTCPVVFVVENKVNLLTLPPVKGAIALGGLGKAVSLLRDVEWLRNATIYYWGDFDVEGFEILSQFRSIFEQTRSILMDMEVFQRHSMLAIPWANKPSSIPLTLTETERAVYDHLLHNGLRLEQERIPQDEIISILRQPDFVEPRET